MLYHPLDRFDELIILKPCYAINANIMAISKLPHQSLCEGWVIEHDLATPPAAQPLLNACQVLIYHLKVLYSN
jgi:hypothetical protein